MSAVASVFRLKRAAPKIYAEALNEICFCAVSSSGDPARLALQGAKNKQDLSDWCVCVCVCDVEEHQQIPWGGDVI